jgi:hypothetical protein
MRRTTTLLFGCWLLAAGSALASPINGVSRGDAETATGFVSDVDFTGSGLSDGDAVTTQFASDGIVFDSGDAFFNNGVGQEFPPNITDPSIANFQGNPDGTTYSMQFTQAITSAAFAIVTNPGSTTFEAYNNGVLQESFVGITDSSGAYLNSNFFGFNGIAFDEIRFSVESDGSGADYLLDNVLIGPAFVPEPSSLALLSIGAVAGSISYFRRKKTPVVPATV